MLSLMFIVSVEPGVPDETILAAMLEHPVLVNRPIVCTPKGVALCRPSEKVLDLLDKLPPADAYAKAVFPTVEQQEANKAAVTSGWDKVVGANVQ